MSGLFCPHHLYRNRLSACVLAVVAAGMLFASTAHALGNLHGHGRVERIKGDPGKGYLELYEYKAFLTPQGSGTGYSYHMGDPGTADHPGQGCMTFDNVNAGNYALMTSWGEFFPRGKVISDVVVNNNQTTQQDALQPIDYSGYYSQSSWDSSGANPIFQTFVATGNTITRASFAKADSTTGGVINFSIHESNGGNVETWPQVGPTRSRNRMGYGGDHWVSWDAGEVPTTPGQTYAIRLYATNGINIQPYWSTDSFYPNGTGYRGSQSSPAGHDYYIVVFSDNDGTIHTMTNRSPGYNNLFVTYHDGFAQSYTARGTSFAGSTLMATLGGASGWQFSVQVSVHSGSPLGTQIGPTKTMPCAFAPFAGVAGAAFIRGEVPTTPGNQYWVVYRRAGGGGFNAYTMNEGNTYAGGSGATLDGGGYATISQDLLINIFEYAATTTPTPTPSPTASPTPAAGANLLNNWSFESSSGQTHPSWTNNSNFGTNTAFPNPGSAQDGSQWTGWSHGAATPSQQELYQTVSVTPGHTYRLAAYLNAGGTDGTAVGKLLWANGGYPGKGNGTLVDSETWTHPSSSISWTELSGLVTPSGSTLTFILRIEIDGWGGGVNYDACSVVDQTVSNTPTPTPTPTRTPTPTNTPAPTATPTAIPSPTPLPYSGVGSEEWQEYR